MRALPLLLGLLVASPLASAQNETTPPPGPGADEFGPRESLEGQPGVAYGIAVVVGTLAVAGVLAVLSRRQRRGE